jgi:hypothetical protein
MIQRGWVTSNVGKAERVICKEGVRWMRCTDVKKKEAACSREDGLYMEKDMGLGNIGKREREEIERGEGRAECG